MRAWRWGRWVIGIVILVGLVATFDPAAIGALLATASFPLVLVGIGGLTALHLLGAATWRVLARRLADARLGWRATARTYYAAQALGGFTPGSLGADVYRVAAMRAVGESLPGSMLPIVVQRATSYLAVSLLGAIALLVASRPSAFTIGVTIGALGVSMSVIALAGLLFAGAGPLQRVRERLLGPGAGDRKGMASAVGVGLGLGLVFHVLGVGLTYLLVLAVEPSAAGPAALAAVAIARVSLLVPITPSGLGIQEAVLAGLFVGIGQPADVALAASLLARMSLLLTAGIGVGAMVLPTRNVASTGDQASAAAVSPTSRRPRTEPTLPTR